MAYSIPMDYYNEGEQKLDYLRKKDNDYSRDQDKKAIRLSNRIKGMSGNIYGNPDSEFSKRFNKAETKFINHNNMQDVDSLKNNDAQIEYILSKSKGNSLVDKADGAFRSVNSIARRIKRDEQTGKKTFSDSAIFEFVEFI